MILGVFLCFQILFVALREQFASYFVSSSSLPSLISPHPAAHGRISFPQSVPA